MSMSRIVPRQIYSTCDMYEIDIRSIALHILFRYDGHSTLTVMLSYSFQSVHALDAWIFLHSSFCLEHFILNVKASALIKQQAVVSN